jgi:hypothetical protein
VPEATDKPAWQKWPRPFAPTAHTLNDKIVWTLPVSSYTSGEESKNPTEITLGEAFKQVLSKGEIYKGGNASVRILSIKWPPLGTLEIETEAGNFRYGGKHFNVALLAAILSLHRDGFESSASRWCWYHSHLDEYSVTHSFFVTCGNKTALERVTFSDHRDSGFNPDVFDPPDYRGDYTEHPVWNEAWIRHYYRSFYRETITGQLMVLRPDEPALYYFPEGRWQPEDAVYVLSREIYHVRLLLYALIGVGIAIIITLLWK